ncbi:hypothetical protein AVEN_237708-1 [Araneus ventricosus]|uniref:Uncharacterized protein n=1 Tax=Araneus ventricosus TaxID=182803 RepID=A0A4Y2ERF1_ARAVE|nr:hypothetical protein AVEN_237708-1 [Araneus ventricosus]
MTSATLELAPPSPSLRSTPAGGCLTQYVLLNVQQDGIHCGSSVKSGFEPESLRSRNRAFITWPSRPSCGIIRQAFIGLLVWDDSQMSQGGISTINRFTFLLLPTFLCWLLD